MQLTHVDLKTLFSLLYKQQEDIETLTARLASCERTLQETVTARTVHAQENGHALVDRD